jgi:hypothetical protein
MFSRISKDINVPRLIEETDKLYTRIVEKFPEKTKLQLTIDKVISERGWSPSMRLIKGNFERVVKELNYFFVPKIMKPGPIFVFPLRSPSGGYEYAQTKPLEGSVLWGAKYHFVGERPFAPHWLGSNPETLKAAIKLRSVLVVEGPFDLLACRLLCPDLPIMSPLTKKVGDKHEAYLRMLGVKRLYLMYDNEESKKEGQSLGAGNLAMEYQATQIKSMEVIPLMCPASDPSEALKMESRAKKLKGLINRAFGIKENNGDIE